MDGASVSQMHPRAGIRRRVGAEEDRETRSAAARSATCQEADDADLGAAIVERDQARARRAVPAPRRRRASRWLGGCSATECSPKKSCRRCSSARGASPSATTPRAVRCGRSCSRRCTAGRSTCCAPRPRAARASSAMRCAIAARRRRPRTRGARRSPKPKRCATRSMTLSDGERAAIELAYFGGHTYKEVAVLARAARRHREEPDPVRAAAPAGGADRGGSARVSDADRTPTPRWTRSLGAYVLDALEPDERARVERLPRRQPHARAEVDELRETTAVLAAAPLGDEPAPPELWDAHRGRGQSTTRATQRASTSSRHGARRRRRRRCGSRRPWPRLRRSSRIVLAVQVVVAERRSRRRATSRRVRTSRRSSSGPPRSTVRAQAALDVGPTASARGSSSCPTAPATSCNDDASALPDRPDVPAVGRLGDETDPASISAGVLGPDPAAASFRSTARSQAFALTVEGAGGVGQRDARAVSRSGPSPERSTAGIDRHS